MRILRTLLSYSLIISLLTVAVLVYLYRDQLVPEAKAMYEEYRTMLIAAVQKLPTTIDANNHKDILVSVEQAPSTDVDQGETKQETTSKNTSSDLAAIEQESSAVSVPGPKLEQTEEIEGVEPDSTHSGTPASVVVKADDDMPPADEMATASVSTVPEQENIDGNESSPEPTETVAVKATPEAMVAQESENDRSSDVLNVEIELLARARNAFWRGQLDEAVSAYQELVDTNPADPNAYGELGNVYYATGNWEKAADAFYEAAQRLIERGQPTAQLDYLLHILQGLNAEKAEDLAKQRQGRI